MCPRSREPRCDSEPNHGVRANTRSIRRSTKGTVSTVTRSVLTCLSIILCSGSSFAGVLTVGPGGTYPSVSAALATLIGAGGDNEIRVAAGVVSGPIALASDQTIGIVTISGGWNADFTTRSDDPSLSVLDGGGTGPVVNVILNSGKLILNGLTIRDGASALSGGGGGGVAAQAYTGAGLIIENCRIEENRCESAADVSGAGLRVLVSDSGAFDMGDTVVLDNVAHSTSGGSIGGGARVSLEGSASGRIHGCRFVGNQAVTEASQAIAAGVFVTTYDSASCELRDNLVADNAATGHNGHPATAAGAALWASDSSTIMAQRNVFLRNQIDANAGDLQVSLTTTETSQVTLADSVVASGANHTGGVDAWNRGGALKIVNTTIAANTSYGLNSVQSAGTVSLDNCIIDGNSDGDTFIDGSVAQDHDLIGTDPLFVDPSHDDFRVRDGSPAIDAGSDADRAGLDTIDLMGLARSQGGAVDCGAHEHRTSTTRVAAVTHALGFNGTPWRSDIAVSNPSTTDVSVAYTYRRGGNTQTISDTVPAGTTMGWQDFLVDRFGKSSTDSETGALQVYSSNPALLVSSRTYANPAEATPPAGSGTFGQYLDGLKPESFVPYFGRAVIPLLRNDANFYTNIGFLNGGPTCNVSVQLYDHYGGAIGSTVQRSVSTGEWGQINDVFSAAGAGQHGAAYALVGVPSPGDEVWFYASVIDRRTKDPTTVPVVLFDYAPHSYRLPAAAHLAGAGGTPWRTTLALVNVSTQDETVTLVFRGAATISRTVSLPANHTKAWNDLLVDLFGLPPTSSDSGSVEIQSDKAVVAAARSYADMGAAGTYGQFLPPEMLDHDGITPQAPGTLQHIRRDAHFYTNVGLLNLGSKNTQVRITLRDTNGTTIGSPVTTTVPQARWLQVNDIFSAAGAGNVPLATATVEVLTPGGVVSGYASVIDRDSHDPTTVPLLQAFAVWPGLGDPHHPVG